MDRLRWTEKPITFRSLVDNPSIQKPALVQIGTKSIVVGEKINGEFITASPCKVSNNRFDVMDQEIVLSSKHTGIWRIISEATWKKEGYIHRLTTKDIERIYKQDVANERPTPRSYICTKDIEGFEVHLRPNDLTVVNGQRADRRKLYIEENVEFIITDTGEVEYTPSNSELTSQDYIEVQKFKPTSFLQLFLPGKQNTEQLIRNRAVRTLYCTTKNEPQRRHFLLEVNEQPCDIRPIASEGSTELRYLHSTQNLFNYMLNYGNGTFLYVKLLRGDPPIKAVEFDGYMVLKSVLNGDKIPICRTDDLEITLVNPDLPIRVKLPIGDNSWRLLPEIRAAEVQCMQLSLALFARHESEMYVTIETEKNTSNYLQSNSNYEQRTGNSRRSSDALKKHIEECEQILEKQLSVTKHQNNGRSEHKIQSTRNSFDDDERKNIKLQTPKSTRSLPLSHPASDKLYRNDEKRTLQEHVKTDQQVLEQKEKFKQLQQKFGQDKPKASSRTVSSTNAKTKANIV